MPLVQGAINSTLSGDKDQASALLTELTGAKLRIFGTGFTPTYSTAESAFVAAETTFTGYSAGGYTLTWSTIGTSGGVQTFVSNRVFAQPTGATPGLQIGGFWVELAGGTLEYYVLFAAPVDMSELDDILAIVIYQQFPGWGYCTIES